MLASVAALRRAIYDPVLLARAVPGVQRIAAPAADRRRARIRFGVGPLSTGYDVDLTLCEADGVIVVAGSAAGRFGEGRAQGEIRLSSLSRGCAHVRWSFEGAVTGPVAALGAGLLSLASESFCEASIRGLAEQLRLEAAVGPPERAGDEESAAPPQSEG